MGLPACLLSWNRAPARIRRRSCQGLRDELPNTPCTLLSLLRDDPPSAPLMHSLRPPSPHLSYWLDQVPHRSALHRSGPLFGREAGGARLGGGAGPPCVHHPGAGAPTIPINVVLVHPLSIQCFRSVPVHVPLQTGALQVCYVGHLCILLRGIP